MAKKAGKTAKKAAKRAAKTSSKPADQQTTVQPSSAASRDEVEALKSEARAILEAAGFRVSRNMFGALTAYRTEFGQERRYRVQANIEITRKEVQDHFDSYKGYRRNTDDFDDYWLVGRRIADEPIRLSPENDRRFRVMDIDQLAKLVEPPRPRNRGGKAQTKIGKAIEQNEHNIQIVVTALILQIDAKLEELKQNRPNSDEAILNLNGQVSEYERMRAELVSIRDMVAAFIAGQVKEAAVVKSVTTFRDGIKNWWQKGHEAIIGRTYDTALFLSSVGALKLMEADMKTGMIVAGALIGGKTVAGGLKGLSKKIFGA
ncbi:hypothetical protein [Bradyrhizobium sp. 25ACV]